jgi:hypothetical protein
MPTRAPTLTPTTAKPTVMPTPTPTTVRPTQAPTLTPTTARPTVAPTPTPTTFSPSQDVLPLLEQCCKIINDYGLRPHKSWGSTPRTERKWWDQMNCNSVVGNRGSPNCQTITSAPATAMPTLAPTLPATTLRPTPTPTVIPTGGPVQDCTDRLAACPQWAPRYCNHHAYGEWMRATCSHSCQSCRTECDDDYTVCHVWKKRGFCTGRYSAFMQTYCKKSCDTCDIEHPIAARNLRSIPGFHVPPLALQELDTEAALTIPVEEMLSVRPTETDTDGHASTATQHGSLLLVAAALSLLTRHCNTF